MSASLETLTRRLPGLLYRCRNDELYSTEFVSDGVAGLTGYPAADFRSGRRHFGDLIHPEDRGLVRAKVDAALAADQPFELTYRILDAAGAIRWVWEKGCGVRDARGAVAALEGFVADVNERKLAHEALRQSEQRLRAIIEAEPECVKVVGKDGRLLEMNPAGLAMLEAGSLAEALARPLVEFIVPGYRAAFVGLHRRVMAGESGSLEFEVEGLKGGLRRLETHAVPLRDAHGAVESLLAITRDVTEHRRAEQTLRATAAHLRMLVESSPLAIYTRDIEGRITSWNPAAEKIYGWSAAEVIGRPLPSIPPAKQAESAALRRRVLAGEPFIRHEAERRGRDGSILHVDAFLGPLRDGAGKIAGIITIVADVTERKAAEARIRRLNRVYAVLSGINGLIVRVRDRRELYREACRIAVEQGGFALAWIGEVDRAAMEVRPVAGHGTDERFFAEARMTIREDAAEGLGVVGEAVRRLVPIVVNDAARDSRIRAKGPTEGNLRSLVILPLAVGGEARGVLALHSDVPGFFDDEEMKLLTELAGDIAFALEHIDKAERVNYLAYYDALTGLANSALFQERLGQFVEAAARARSKVALLVLDVERFKSINDSLGRQAGDALLVELAGRLARAADRSALARIGADHFAVVVPAVKGRSETIRTVEHLLRECFARPFVVAGAELRVAARAGVALYPSDGADAQALFANAEAALAQAQDSAERYCFHTRELTAGTRAQLALENELRRALERDEFILHYQPKVASATRVIVGMEALIRWQSPERGLVPPREFIPLLEETGLILPVGAWALRRAALDHRAWTQQGLRPPRVAVNVSAIQLRQRDFVAQVEQAIMEGVAPVGIDLEITESLVMADIEASHARLAEARALGLKIAIDDFGTGYSSLAYLARLPVHALKIDRSFIVAMLREGHTMTLVRTIVSLAHSLGLRVIAEGVDDEAQASVLHALGCDEMQGYLFSRPVPFAQMSHLLASPSKPSAV